MKKYVVTITTALIMIFVSLFAGCASFEPERPRDVYPSHPSPITEETPFVPTEDVSRNSALSKPDNVAVFTPWNINAASKSVEKRGKKPYTIMVYMNGSDLESEEGAATYDLIEMLESGLRSENANLVILTGGAKRWRNDVVPANECALWEIEDGLLYEISRIGLLNMGDPGTLSGFIEFSLNNFPADKYGLIMWDHGGGSIVGYGYDEKFLKSNLTLSDMDYAFEMAGLNNKKLEFLGFDACLMATAEMASVASRYAKYLVASEDVEPGDGWDYGFLSVLNRNPNITGAELGKVITDSFMDYYGPNTDQILTLSVIDLSKVGALTAAVDNLMRSCSWSLVTQRDPSFNFLARQRNLTKTFGEGTPRDNDCDMVDIGDMVAKISGIYPSEAAKVLKELDNCVIYNRHNSDIDLKGLSVYYIYGGKRFGRESLEIYRALNVNREHAGYLDGFFGLLMSGGQTTRSGNSTRGPGEIIETKLTLWEKLDKTNALILTGIKQSDGLWPSINDQKVCMYKINSANNGELYAIPAEHNGSAGDIIVLVSSNYPKGKILGVRREDGIIIQKGYDDIEKGDTIAFYYQTLTAPDEGETNLIVFLGENWLKGEAFTVGDPLEIKWEKAADSRYEAQMLTDVRGNNYLSFED